MIGFYISESIKYFRRSKLSTLISVITLCIGILFTLLSLMLVMLSSRIDEKFKSRIELEVFLEDSLTSSQINELRRQVSNEKIVSKVDFVSKKDALEELQKETGDDFASILSYNPLPNSLKVRFGENITEETLNNFRQLVKSKNGVVDVVYDRDLILSILQFVRSVKVIVYVFSVLLIIVSVYLVYSNTKLILLNKSEQFSTMKLVGAKLSAIKIPLVLNGFMKGLLSGVISLFVINVIIIILQKFSFEIEFVNNKYLFNFLPLIIGSLLGISGSLLFTKSITLKVDIKDKLKK